VKVVLFCGGLGTRLREHSNVIPKPLVNIGPRPIMWHLMKYYAHHGYKDFILCLGYQGDMIKDFFLNYNECISNDFVLRNGGKDIELFNSDIDDWNITFVDTGLASNIGQRLMLVKEHLGDDEMFMANYSDGLTDLPLDDHVNHFKKSDAVASFISVKPSQSFHTVKVNDEGYVTDIAHMNDSNIWINAGYMILKKAIFDYMKPGEEIVEQPFERLLEKKKLLSYKYKGFWKPMDTFKDKKSFDTMYEAGNTPWQVWKN